MKLRKYSGPVISYRFVNPKNLEHHRQMVADCVAEASGGAIHVDSETLDTHQLLRDLNGKLVLLIVPWPTGYTNWVRNVHDWGIASKVHEQMGPIFVSLCRIGPQGLHFNRTLPFDAVPTTGQPVNRPSCGGVGTLIKEKALETLPRLKHPVITKGLTADG